MDVIETTSKMEFDVIYADGTRRHVEEGILYEVMDGESIFHMGTNRPAVVLAASGNLLKSLKHIGPGLEALSIGMCLDAEAADALRELVSYSIRLIDPERSVKHAIFRLGQMDMRESIADMLESEAHNNALGIVAATLRVYADKIRAMEIPSGRAPIENT